MITEKFLSILVPGILIISASSYGDTNVLTNPDFEDGTTSGWFGRGCSIQPVSSPVYGGSYSARAYNRTNTWQGIQQNINGLVLEGETYFISGWVRLENASSSPVGITVQQTDNSGTQYIPIAWSTGSDTGWTNLSGNFTLNVNGNLTGLDIYFEGPPADVNFYVDDAVVYGPESSPEPPPPPPPVDPNAAGYIDTSARRQILEGFGGANVWSGYTLVTLGDYDPNIYDVIFGELGLDILRLRNTYGYDTGYMNNCQHTITNGRARTGRPLKIMISAWSPEAQLKSNGRTDQGGTLAKHPDTGEYLYDEYAQWWARSLTQYERRSIVADYINIQNEPDYNASWDSCRFEPNETESFPGYDRAFEAVYQELYSQMGPAMPKMLVSDCTGFNRAGEYINDIEDLSHVYGYSHHLYNCYNGGNAGCGDDPDLYILPMAFFGTTYNDKPIFMTEYSDDSHDTTYDACMDLALLMHNSLTIEQVAGYIYWQLTYGQGDGLVSITSTSWTINPIYYAMKHYSAFTDPNWQRIDAATDSNALRISAFISPDNKQLSAIIINTHPETDIYLDVSLLGEYDIKNGDIYQTSQLEENYCDFIGTYDPAYLLTLPADSITTLVLALGTPPVADAGPDQTVEASASGSVDVSLDGSGSYDNEGDPLNYLWRWTIGSIDYQANGISPVINLPAGQHTIELIVDDGYSESEPDYCTINVTASSIKTTLLCYPHILKSNHKCGPLFTIIPMPEGIGKKDIDCSEPLMFNPGQIESSHQKVYQCRYWRGNKTFIWAWFNKSECLQHLDSGTNEVCVTGQLISGQYFEATGHVYVIPKRWHFWKKSFWGFGCGFGFGGKCGY